MSYPLTHIDGIDSEAAALLKAARIRSTDRLLDAAATLKGRKALSAKTGLDCKRLLSWANMADRMRVKGVRKDYAELLQAAGVETVRELQHRNPAKLAARMAAANKTRKLVRVLPSEKIVARWIDDAKTLPMKISY